MTSLILAVAIATATPTPDAYQRGVVAGIKTCQAIFQLADATARAEWRKTITAIAQKYNRDDWDATTTPNPRAWLVTATATPSQTPHPQATCVARGHEWQSSIHRAVVTMKDEGRTVVDYRHPRFSLERCRRCGLWREIR
jgi:hypothetical protein